jgi:hypothetical protein
MDNIICKVCDRKFDNDSGLHKHLKTHKMTQAEYYQKFYPRRDRSNGSLIKYKNKEFYFSAEFNSKNNLKAWLDSVAPITGEIYTKNFLLKRKEKKGLVYAPTQIELRTLMVPGIKYINEKFGDYNQFCEKLGFKVRFPKKELDQKDFKDISKKVIFADSREQNPLDFDNTTRTKGMSFGDYRMANSNIYIERKSLGDAWGTLSGGIERFEREIIRAKEAGAYLIILVESSFDSLEKFPTQRQVYGKIKIPIEFIHHNIRDLLQKHECIQFLFVRNRDEASRIIQKIFSADEQVKQVDLQYLYDIGEL